MKHKERLQEIDHEIELLKKEKRELLSATKPEVVELLLEAAGGLERERSDQLQHLARTIEREMQS